MAPRWWTVAANDLRRRRRDWSVVIQGVLAPIGLALIVGLAFGDAGNISATIGVADADGSELSGDIARSLVAFDDDSEAGSDDGPLRFVVADPTTVFDAVADGDLDAALVLPDGFGASVLSTTGGPGVIEVITDPERTIAGGIAESVASGVAARVDATRLALAATFAAGGTTEVAEIMALQADAEPLILVGESVSGSFDVISFFAPSMAILFLFFTVGAAARSLLVEQQEGTLVRVRASPISDNELLAGKTLSVMLGGLVSFAVVWGATSLLFGSDWGDPVGVAMVIVATVAAIAGISTLVTGLARSVAAADGMSSAIAFVFALIGGNFLQPGVAPPLLATLGLATPNGWALRAFTELAAGEAGPIDVLAPVLVLAAWAVLTGAIGTRLLRRRLAT